MLMSVPICGLLVITAFTLMRLFLVVVTVEQESMFPTLLHGDRVLVLRHWPARWLRRGKIVIVRPRQLEYAPIDEPKSSGKPGRRFGCILGIGSKPFGDEDPSIKRVVGLPGETLVTYLTELDDVKRIHQRALHDQDGKRVWHIPPDHFFVQGDSLYSTDSRDWGPSPFHNLLGLAFLKLPRQAVVDLARIPDQENSSAPQIEQSESTFKVGTMNEAEK